MNMDAKSFSQFIQSLSESDRIHFYELLAHNLTVSIRDIWGEPQTTTEEKLEGMKQIYEVLHRITAKVWTERLKTYEWNEEDIWGMLTSTAPDAAETQINIDSAVRLTVQYFQNGTKIEQAGPANLASLGG